LFLENIVEEDIIQEVVAAVVAVLNQGKTKF